MALVVLVEALGVEEVDVRYCSVGDFNRKVIFMLWRWGWDSFGLEGCEVLVVGKSWCTGYMC